MYIGSKFENIPLDDQHEIYFKAVTHRPDPAYVRAGLPDQFSTRLTVEIQGGEIDPRTFGPNWGREIRTAAKGEVYRATKKLLIGTARGFHASHPNPVRTYEHNLRKAG